MTSRVHDRRPASAVGEALGLIPRGLRGMVACEFIIGVDPVFAGIHGFTTTEAGRAYGETAHCVLDCHQAHRPRSERGVKVVLPARGYEWDSWGGVRVVVHELGHVLHDRTDTRHVAEAVSAYAETDHYEAFAEAFAAWVWGEPIDNRTAALFDGLAYA